MADGKDGMRPSARSSARHGSGHTQVLSLAQCHAKSHHTCTHTALPVVPSSRNRTLWPPVPDVLRSTHYCSDVGLRADDIRTGARL